MRASKDPRVEIEELQEQVRQLQEALVPPKHASPAEWRLTPSEACVYSHLCSRDLATKESIMTALYSSRTGDEPGIRIIEVFIHKLRRKIRPFGVEIETVRGIGFRLKEPDRAPRTGANDG